MSDFTDLVNVASERLGGRVLWVNDEFFAPGSRLLKDSAPEFIERRYTDRGKWMDGWETRRRREPGHDQCVIRLGLPSVIHGVIVDTSHFRGNYPDACSFEATELHGYPSLAEVLDPGVSWREVLGRQPLEGHAQNRFAVRPGQPWTHLRFNIFPDGGVARLRVFGRPHPGRNVIGAGREIDLAAVEHGGLVIAASDMFFGSRHNLILPGQASGMSDGWETRRRRGPGHDWVVIELGHAGTLRRVEVDTTHFKGNAPATCTVEGCDCAGIAPDEVLAPDRVWQTLLASTALQPDTRHLFDLDSRASSVRVTHARFNIFPDGGVARLRLYGTPIGEA